MRRTTLKSPFGWIGGKSKLSKDIIDLIPDDHKIYIEVFGGAASVLFGKEKSKLEVLNDINSELINLHRAIRNNPETLSFYLNQMLVAREIFEDIRKRRWKPRNKIEAAAFYIYQLTHSFGSKAESFAMNAKSGRKPKDLYKSYNKWSTRLKGVTIENRSFQKLIPLYDKEDAFFYLDPPYVSSEHCYKNTGGFGIKEHEELAELLSNIKGRFLLSYNDNVVVRELYKGFNIRTTKEINYTLGANRHKVEKKVKEVFISNY
ncbi:DNA adenine methylase [Halarcobacter sp.]|uniref:DNA adenine methylase n=1 Tax=Halarcobacter sp. TaxID=2321133 RepID=UPI0029F54020|nr:DNA adenine methylase [Halarcobacter sp.]